MRYRTPPVLLALLTIGMTATPARAGMPSVTFDDLAALRLQTISFFAACLLLCAWGVKAAWNAIGKDFPTMPRLSFGRASGLVALWGLLFLLVLTMISGARELMTPGAWRKDGLTYKLDERPSPPAADPDLEFRRQSLDRLRVALWTYARGHDGRFPADIDAPEIPPDAWRIPDPSGMRYLYVGGQVADRGLAPLAYEPGVFGADRFVLMTNGEILSMDRGAIARALDDGGPR